MSSRLLTAIKGMILRKYYILVEASGTHNAQVSRNPNALFVFRIYTEIWDENFTNGEKSKHFLGNNDYVFEATLFLVDQNICSQNITHHVDPELGSGQFWDDVEWDSF